MAHDDTTRLITTMIGLRRSRFRRFPSNLFAGEMAWDMLLVLFEADARGERLTARQLIGRVDGNVATGERWLSYLNAEGLISGDSRGHVDDLVSPTPATLQAIEEWAETMLEPLRAFSQSKAT